MPYCKNNKKKFYNGTEPSPKGLGWCASGEKVGVKKKGNDGNIWIIKMISSGFKRWVKLKPIDKNIPLGYKLNCSKFIRYKLKGPNEIKILEGLQGKKGYIYKSIGFNTFENKEIKVPSGYKPIKVSSNFIKKYNCNSSKYRLQKDNKEYKNIINKTKGSKIFFIHDNGGRPFLVYIGKKEVYIYKQNEKNFYILLSDFSKDYKKNAWMYISLIKKYKPLKVFIGKSPKNEMTKFSGGYGKYFNGNSILLQISVNKYVFIGKEIYSFISINKIIKYISPVGNSDVPYPYAIDEQNRYFLFNESVILEKIPKQNNQEPYEYYYKNILITSNNKNNISPNIKYFNDINKYYIGKNKYMLTYVSKPKSNYERLIPELGKKMYIVKTDGKKYELTKQMYVKLMKNVGNHMGFKLLKSKIIQKRIL